MEEDSWLCFYATISVLDLPLFKGKQRKCEGRKEKMLKEIKKNMIAKNIPSPSLELPIRRDPLTCSKNLMET